MNKKSFSPRQARHKQHYLEGPSLLLQRKSNNKKNNGGELKICETDLMNNYQANQRLMLNKETQEKIKKSLQIDWAAEAGYYERENIGRFFLTYNNNPFTQEFYMKTLNYDELQNLQKSEKINIFEGLKRKKRAIQLGNDLKQKFLRLDQSLIQLSRRIASHRLQINYDKMSEQQIVDPKQIVSAIYQMSTKNQNYIEQLQRIVNLREQKALINGHQDIDIFKFRFKPKSRSFQTIFQRLLKYNFQTESVIYQLIKQTKINPFNHISTYSRSCIASRKKRTLAQLRYEKSELATKIDDIKFQQLLFLVAGKVRSEELLQYLNANFQQKSQFQEAKVYLQSRQGFNFYQKNQRHRTTYIDNSIDQIEKKWVNLPYQIEYKEKMQKIRKIYQFCTKCNIQDQYLNDYLNIKKERIVCGLFDNAPHKFKDIDSKIIKLKKSKDGFEKNRNRAVSQILIECKKFIKQKSKKNSNQSKNKTQQSTYNINSWNHNIEKKAKFWHTPTESLQHFTSKNSPREKHFSKNPSPKYSPKHKFQYTIQYSPKKNQNSFSKTLSLIKNFKHKSFIQKEQKYRNQYNLLVKKAF